MTCKKKGPRSYLLHYWSLFAYSDCDICASTLQIHGCVNMYTNEDALHNVHMEQEGIHKQNYRQKSGLPATGLTRGLLILVK